MRARQRGMALLVTLWMLAVLLVLASTFALGVRTEVVLAGSYVRKEQSFWMAEAGLQRAFVELQQNPLRFTALAEQAEGRDALVLYLDSADEASMQFDEGRFRVAGYDENALLNLNVADEDLLRAVLPTEPELVDAILDWRDEDDLVREAGAESDYYAQLEEPYRSRDGWFETVPELLLLRDVSPARLLGNENLSPLADPEETTTVDEGLVPLEQLFTTASHDANVDLNGNERLDLRTVTEDELTQEFGEVLSPEEIQAILRYRDENGGGEQGAPGQAETPGPAPGAPGTPGGGQALPGGLSPEEQDALNQLGQATAGQDGTPGGDPAEQPEGPSVAGLVTVLERDKLRQVYDRFTSTDEPRQLGAVNLNTATPEVLAALPGMDESLAQLIVTARQDEPFETVADLLRLTEVDDATFEEIAPSLTTRSLVVRLTAEGTIGEGRQAQSNRIEALVIIELAPAQSEEAAAEGEAPNAAGGAAADEPPRRTLRLVYRRME